MAYIQDNPAEETGFVTTDLLLAGATYTSPVLDVDGFTQVQTEINASHDGTIEIFFCSDEAATDVVRTLTIPYVAANGYQFFAAPAFVNFIKYEFTNTALVTQTDFYYTTKITRTAVEPQLLTTGAFISPAMITSLNRSILTGQDPDGSFMNVLTTRAGNLDVTIADANDGFNAKVTPGQSLKVADQTHLVGEAYGDAALLTEKYIITLANGGTQDASIAGQLEMKTNTTANGSVKIQTTDVARFIPANYNTTHHAVTIPEFPRTTNNLRRWGAFNEADGNPINGNFFQLEDGVWSVGHAINGVITLINQSSWTGNGADTFNADSQSAQVYEIEYNAGSIRYTVNGRTVHRVGLLTTPYAADIHFPSSMVNENTGGSTTNVDLFLRAGAIYTLGKGEGVARPKFITGTTTGTVIKTSPGKLERVVFSRDGTGASTSTMEIYDDNVAPPAASTQVGRIDLTGDGASEIEYDFIFNKGLVIIISNSGGGGTIGTTITFD